MNIKIKKYLVDIKESINHIEEFIPTKPIDKKSC